MNFSMMQYRTRVLTWWARRIVEFRDSQSWSTNRHEPRPPGAKTLALLVPASVRERVETVQRKWRLLSFARTGQTALMVGLSVMEAETMPPDPRHYDLMGAIVKWVRAGHPTHGAEYVELARVSERWMSNEEDTRSDDDEDG